MYIYIYVYVYVYLYICKYVYIYIHIDIYIYTNTQVVSICLHPDISSEAPRLHTHESALQPTGGIFNLELGIHLTGAAGIIPHPGIL